MAKCKSCGADIVWIETRSGKQMPCDAGLIPFWAKVKAKEKIVTDSGDVVSCLLDGDPEEMTGLGAQVALCDLPVCRQAQKEVEHEG